MDWLLLLLGFLIAVFAAITGVGGGVLFVPLLTLGYGFLPAQAVGTSLMVMVFGGFGATIGYAIQKRVYFRAGLLLALATAPGAVSWGLFDCGSVEYRFRGCFWSIF